MIEGLVVDRTEEDGVPGCYLKISDDQYYAAGAVVPLTLQGKRVRVTVEELVEPLPAPEHRISEEMLMGMMERKIQTAEGRFEVYRYASAYVRDCMNHPKDHPQDFHSLDYFYARLMLLDPPMARELGLLIELCGFPLRPSAFVGKQPFPIYPPEAEGEQP